MARGRMIDRRISSSKKLGIIDDRARVIWVWLYVYTDKEGRVKFDDLEDLIQDCIPRFQGYSIKSVIEALEALDKIDLLVLYPHEDPIHPTAFALQFERFKDFQSIREDREGASRVPAPPESSRITPGAEREHYRFTPLLSLSLSLSKFKEGRNEKKTIIVPTFEEVDTFLTTLLIDLMRENLPSSHIVKRYEKSETIQADWIRQCRLMRQRDERTAIEIETLIRWSQKDDFWRSNILSMSKLRKQFDRLLLQAKKTNYAGIREWLREVENEQ